MFTVYYVHDFWLGIVDSVKMVGGWRSGKEEGGGGGRGWESEGGCRGGREGGGGRV